MKQPKQAQGAMTQTERVQNTMTSEQAQNMAAQLKQAQGITRQPELGAKQEYENIVLGLDNTITSGAALKNIRRFER